MASFLFPLVYRVISRGQANDDVLFGSACLAHAFWTGPGGARQLDLFEVKSHGKQNHKDILSATGIALSVLGCFLGIESLQVCFYFVSGLWRRCDERAWSSSFLSFFAPRPPQAQSLCPSECLRTLEPGAINFRWHLGVPGRTTGRRPPEGSWGVLQEDMAEKKLRKAGLGRRRQ